MTTQPTLTSSAFAAKWKGVETGDKASSQSHFIDLCRMLGEPTPHEADPIGSQYAFEKRVVKADGGVGFADVWKRDFFAWELGNPPRPITSDIARIETDTNFTSLSPAGEGSA